MSEDKQPELPPEVKGGEAKLGNNGTIVFNNRRYRRLWRNRAMMEGKPTKKWYTVKKTKCRRKREQRNRQTS